MMEHQKTIDPASGYLACGDTGAGKMPEPETLFSYIMKDHCRSGNLYDRRAMILNEAGT